MKLNLEMGKTLLSRHILAKLLFVVLISFFIRVGWFVLDLSVRQSHIVPDLLVSNDKHSIELGTVFANSYVARNYLLQNNLDRGIDINSIVCSCGCINATVDKKHLDPKESGTLSVEAHFGPASGDIHQSIEISIYQAKRIIIQVTAKSIDVVDAQPYILSWHEHGSVECQYVRVHSCVKEIHDIEVLPVSSRNFIVSVCKQDQFTSVLSVRPLELKKIPPTIILCKVTLMGEECKAIRVYALIE